MNAQPQHMTALDNANRIRLGRAKIKRDLGELERDQGRIRAAQLILDPPDVLENMTLTDLLTAIHRVGLSHAKRWLRELGASEARTIGHLTERQRALLAGILLTCRHKIPVRDECLLCEASERVYEARNGKL